MPCRQCGAPVSGDEIGLTKKLINRGSTDYLCINCLAAFFGCTTDRLREKADQFRRQGCALFAPLPVTDSCETDSDKTDDAT